MVTKFEDVKNYPKKFKGDWNAFLREFAEEYVAMKGNGQTSRK